MDPNEHMSKYQHDLNDKPGLADSFLLTSAGGDEHQQQGEETNSFGEQKPLAAMHGLPLSVALWQTGHRKPLRCVCHPSGGQKEFQRCYVQRGAAVNVLCVVYINTRLPALLHNNPLASATEHANPPDKAAVDKTKGR
eukprot:1495856-Amphidinium_carterae.2